jgi:hypothetical protein
LRRAAAEADLSVLVWIFRCFAVDFGTYAQFVDYHSKQRCERKSLALITGSASGWIYIFDGLLRIPASVRNVELSGAGVTLGGHFIDHRRQAFLAEKAYVLLGRPKIVGAIMVLSL